MPLLRALFFTDPLIILATLFFGCLNLAVSFFDAGGARQISLARIWARILLRVSGVRVTVEGLEKLPADSVCVLAVNHLSYMDTPVVLAHLPLPFRFLAKHGLFQIPLLGSHLARAGHIPVYRGNPRRALKTLSHAAETIQQRRISLLVFPEGGRSHSGVLRPFTDGAAYIAIKARAPLVPVALIGTREILPMGSMQPRPGRVVIKIADPIPTESVTLHDRARLTELARSRVAAFLETESNAPVPAAVPGPAA